MGGFKIVSNDIVENPSFNLRIQIAYMVAKGKPLKKYNPFDFDLATDQFLFEFDGLQIESRANNSIELHVEASAKFYLKVSGFDESRDLFIKIT